MFELDTFITLLSFTSANMIEAWNPGSKFEVKNLKLKIDYDEIFNSST